MAKDKKQALMALIEREKGKDRDGLDTVRRSLSDGRIPHSGVERDGDGFVVLLARKDVPVGASGPRVLSSSSLAAKIRRKTGYAAAAIERHGYDGFAVSVKGV